MLNLILEKTSTNADGGWVPKCHVLKKPILLSNLLLFPSSTFLRLWLNRWVLTLSYRCVQHYCWSSHSFHSSTFLSPALSHWDWPLSRWRGCPGTRWGWSPSRWGCPGHCQSWRDPRPPPWLPGPPDPKCRWLVGRQLSSWRRLSPGPEVISDHGDGVTQSSCHTLTLRWCLDLQSCSSTSLPASLLMPL